MCAVVFALLAARAAALAPAQHSALVPTAAGAEKPEARVRLFALYGIADSSSKVAKGWLPGAPEWCDVRFLDLVGHGARSKEALPAYALQEPDDQDVLAACASHRAAVAEELCDALDPFVDEPFALYGFSLGAILLYEVCRVLEARGRPPPLRLFACGRGAPHCCPAARRDYAAVAAGDDEFVLDWMQNLDFPTTTLPKRIRPRAAKLFRMGLLLGAQEGDADDDGGGASPYWCGTFPEDVPNADMPLLAGAPPKVDCPVVAVGSDVDRVWPPRTVDRWADVADDYARVAVPGVAHGDLMNHGAVRDAVFASLEQGLGAR